MKEFIELDKYGRLYMDRVLFESYFPIIFTCINDRNDLFICVCCQNNGNGCKWLIGKTDGISIVRMLQDEITIRQLLLEYSSDRISVDYVGQEYSVSYNGSAWDEDSVYLPKTDSYMYAEEGEFEEEINYFLSMDYVHYEAGYYRHILDRSETIRSDSSEIESLAEDLPVPVDGSIAIPSIVMHTIKVFKKLCPNRMANEEDYRSQGKYKPIINSSTIASSKTSDIEVRVDADSYLDAA